MGRPVRILHLHSTFAAGGKELRCARLMNHFGGRAQHTVLSAVPDALGAREAIDPSVVAEFPEDAPPLAGRPGVRRFRALARYMRGFDLVLSYNWGAMDAVMAHRLGRNLPPLIHHEDGFNQDEADRLKTSRTLYRRFAFETLHRLVVPSALLERIARTVWHQPEARIARIANGIAVDRYAGPPAEGGIPGFVRREGEVVIGTVAGLRAVKNLTALVAATARLSLPVRLVVVGEGPERGAIVAEAERLGIAGRVLLPGFVDRPWRYVGHFDIFALSSLSEQFPISVVEAMAAGLPVVSPDVGDVAAMVSEPNRTFVVGKSKEDGLAEALDILARDADLRASIGAANRARAVAEYDEAQMLQKYCTLYGEAIGQPKIFAGG